MRAVRQEQPMGCGIACVASVADISYTAALNFFNPKHASIRGYYCNEIVDALAANGFTYEFKRAGKRTRKYLQKEGTIVFIAPSVKYPAGHYLVRTRKGWMNPWINYPCIAPVRAGFSRNLPGKAEWTIFEKL